MKGERTISILMAEDDPDDQLLNQEAIEEARLGDEIRFVSDGEELLDYLLQRGKYSKPADAPRPDLIILDLNMPRMDGREALAEIKKNPKLRRIPVVVLTTSRAEEDIVYTYSLGVSGYITKPARFDEMVSAMKAVGRYWFETVQLPPDEHS
ncbi:MAG: response regulator [Chloroflexi bacterium]|jgi:CheY-like chemotaxis protein|nr:response regulator [Chloroflexota bacterium]